MNHVYLVLTQHNQLILIPIIICQNSKHNVQIYCPKFIHCHSSGHFNKNSFYNEFHEEGH